MKKRSHKKLPYHVKVKHDAARRQRSIKKLYDKGLTFGEIAEKLGISRQRVHQIAKR